MSKKTEAAVATKPKKRSQFQETIRRLKKNRSAMIGLAIILLVVLVSVISNFVYDYDTQVIAATGERLQHPSWQHPFGTDELGRDILTRLAEGGRVSISVGLIATLFKLCIGVLLGCIAGLYGGIVESVIMRIVDIIMCFPFFVIALCIAAITGPSFFNTIFIIGILGWPGVCRIVRSQVLSLKNVEYVEAARAVGRSEMQIIFGHVLPNCLSPIIVQTTLRIASAIITAAALSYLGLGVVPPAPEWGAMLSYGRNFIRGYSYMTLFPGLAIMITVLSLNLLGDGLRDALDPKLRK